MLEKFLAVPDPFTFPQFLHFCEQLVAEGKTSGPEQSEFLIHFTKLNYQRMSRWNRTLVLSKEAVETAQNASPQNWFVITEAWCGDSAQNLPVIAKMAEASLGKINLKIVLRDEHPELIEAYLTNSSKSIPKLISFDALSKKELFTWGPRPNGANILFRQWKENPQGRDFEAFEKELHTWYALNKGKETEQELQYLI